MVSREHQILEHISVILNYLVEDRGIIIIGKRGIQWIYNESPKLKKAVEKGVEV